MQILYDDDEIEILNLRKEMWTRLSDKESHQVIFSFLSDIICHALSFLVLPFYVNKIVLSKCFQNQEADHSSPPREPIM